MRLARYGYFAWTVLFILVPLGLILFLGFREDTDAGAVWSLGNFRRFFSPIYLRILRRSVELALYSTLICLLIGYPFAYAISQKKHRDLYMLLVLIPMWMNFLLRTYAWITLLGRKGLLNRALAWIGLGPLELKYNDAAILIGMVYNFLPFMVLPIYTSILKLDPSLVEAGYDLGANASQVFRKVILPLTRGGVATGVTMCFIPAVSTFVISQLLGGNNFNLIGNVIEQQFRFTGDWGFGAAISIVLMVMIWVLLKLSKATDHAVGEGGLL